MLFNVYFIIFNFPSDSIGNFLFFLNLLNLMNIIFSALTSIQVLHLNVPFNYFGQFFYLGLLFLWRQLTNFLIMPLYVLFYVVQAMGLVYLFSFFYDFLYLYLFFCFGLIVLLFFYLKQRNFVLILFEYLLCIFLFLFLLLLSSESIFFYRGS